MGKNVYSGSMVKPDQEGFKLKAGMGEVGDISPKLNSQVLAQGKNR